MRLAPGFSNLTPTGLTACSSTKSESRRASLARLAQIDRDVNLVSQHARGLRPALAGAGFQSYEKSCRTQPLEQCDVGAYVPVVTVEQFSQLVNRDSPLARDRRQLFEPLFRKDARELFDALEAKPRFLCRTIASRNMSQRFA